MAILRAMGPRAEVVRAFLALSEAALYGPAALGRRERELLAVATSQANEAGYSAAAHARSSTSSVEGRTPASATRRWPTSPGGSRSPRARRAAR